MDENKKNETGEIEEEVKPQSSVRTYESDVAEAMRQKNTSLGSVFLAEQEKRQVATGAVAQETPSRTGFYLLMALLFISASAGLIFGAWKYMNREDDVAIIETNSLQAVISDKELPISVTGLSALAIEKKILDSRETMDSTGNIISFFFSTASASTTKTLSAKEFVNAISWRMGGKLVRSLSPKYSVGFYNASEGQIFAVFTTDSYEESFAGMLEWERFIYNDFAALLKEPSDILSTSTPVFLFKDRIVENKDVRALERNGETVLLYSFPDRRTIVIAADVNTFKEVLERLSPERFAPN